MHFGMPKAQTVKEIERQEELEANNEDSENQQIGIDDTGYQDGQYSPDCLQKDDVHKAFTFDPKHLQSSTYKETTSPENQGGYYSLNSQ